MQLCVNVQIPVSHGGVDGTAIFIGAFFLFGLSSSPDDAVLILVIFFITDSEGGFIARRAQQICKETSWACEKCKMDGNNRAIHPEQQQSLT